MISKIQKELTATDIAAIAKTYHVWRGEKKDGVYVGAADIEDDGIPFETKMTAMSQTLYAQMEESKKLDEIITNNLKSLGYGRT